ncbi:photoreceptor outer segment membrane glycoprotein 2-like [Lampetra fluviatilis]
MAILRLKFTRQTRDKLAQALWALNWVSVVAGIVLFALGLSFKIELKKRAEVMEHRNSVQSLPNFLLVVGIVACAINLLGGKICHDCADATRFTRWRIYLLPYIVGTFFFTFVILLGALMCLMVRSDLEEAFHHGLRNGMRFYKDTDTPGRCFLKRTIDLLQMDFRCCGNNGFRDWFEMQWMSARYLDPNSKDVMDRLKSNVDGKYLVDGVPFSCCNPSSPRPCIQHSVTNNSAHYNYDYLTEELNLWMRGCRDALLEHFSAFVHAIATVGVLVWLFELSVLVGVRYLQTSMMNATPPSEEGVQDQNEVCEGWLLENSILETARSNLNIIKNLGKSNQVNADDDEGNASAPPADYGPGGTLPTTILPGEKA